MNNSPIKGILVMIIFISLIVSMGFIVGQDRREGIFKCTNWHKGYVYEPIGVGLPTPALLCDDDIRIWKEDYSYRHDLSK